MWQYSKNFVREGARLNKYFLDGAAMLNPKLKLKYELHYWDTNLIGSSHQDLESAVGRKID